MKQSNFLSLNWRDLFKGFLMAVLTPVFTTLYTSFEASVFTLNWHIIGVSALGGAMAYLSKNFFTKPSTDSPKLFAEDLGGSNPPPGKKDEK